MHTVPVKCFVLIRVYPIFTHNSDVIMSATTSQITGVSIFAQPFVEAQVKDNIKAPYHWTLWGESTGDLMTSWCADQVSLTSTVPISVPVQQPWWHWGIHHIGHLRKMKWPKQNVCIFNEIHRRRWPTSGSTKPVSKRWCVFKQNR